MFVNTFVVCVFKLLFDVESKRLVKDWGNSET